MKISRLRTLLVPLLLVSVLRPDVALAGLNPIGGQRQFFFDDGIVETMENTRRKLNHAVKLADNPVIKRDRPWEGPDMRLAWVIFDQRLGKFRMRYSAGLFRAAGRDEKGEVIVKGEHDEESAKRVVCEAFSDDGVNWVKPELGLVEFEGSTANNILPESALYYYLFEDLHDPDPARRYKAQVRTGTYDGNGMTYEMYYSPDAYTWTAYAGNPIIDTGEQHGRWGPSDFMGWDPIRETYAAHMENNFHMHSPNHHRRSIGRAESPDMITWSEPETIIVVDREDYPDTEFYHFPVTVHEGWYMGFLWMFSTTNTQHEPHFAFSRDGINYDRTYREPIIRRGDNGRFDAVSVYANRPIIHGDEVLCYYTGTNWRSPEQLVVLGDKAEAKIGLAKLPRDGFVSLEGARAEFSRVTTRTFTFEGDELVLNMQAALQQWGAEPCEVKVAILDGRHAPIAGFSFDDADNLSTTAVDQVVTWRGGDADVSALAGQPVRLKIHFKNAKLYAFQFR
jgi:hypothetical protein